MIKSSIFEVISSILFLYLSHFYYSTLYTISAKKIICKLTIFILIYIILNQKGSKKIMNNIFERTINYYETDRMGIVHHSNYIRYLEEARCFLLNELGMPFSLLEENGITIPVLKVDCTYKHHVTFNDTILIKVFIKEYNGVRLTMAYDVKDKKTNKTVIIAETKHCFTNKSLKPINLKKVNLEFSKKFENLFELQKDIL